MTKPSLAHHNHTTPTTTATNIIIITTTTTTTTHPSVPFGTGLKVVMRKVLLPYAFPISLPKVSDSLVDNELM